MTKRYKKLQQFKAEIGCLFKVGFNSCVAFGQLRFDSLFADITCEQVELIYKDLEKKSEDEAEAKRQIAELNPKMDRHEIQIAEAQNKRSELDCVIKQSLSSHLVTKFHSIGADLENI